MTILLDHIPTANNPSARPLRITRRQDESSSERCATTPRSPCGSPPRFRDRKSCNPSRDFHSRPQKAQRSVSPGGTPASSPCLRRASSPVDRRSPSPTRRKVRWATQLEASVMTRPKTCREDIPTLFYSRADERRFRREAEEDERELPPAPSTSPVLDTWCTTDKGSHSPFVPSPERKDYAISKAVVVFGNTTMTFDSKSIWSTPGGCAVEAQATSVVEGFSFDDPAFWNGVLTWS